MSWIVLGQKIKAFRNIDNMKQQDLADKLGISRTTLSYYENGSVEPNIYTLLKLSEIMNCSLDYLFDIDSKPVEFDYSSYTKKIETNSTNDDIDLTISLLKSLLKKVERTFIELEQSKKKTDLMYEELKRTKNRILKIDELYSQLDSIKNNSASINNTDTENADEIVPNIINLEEQKERKKTTYRYIDCFGNVAAGDPRCAFEVLLDTFKINSDLLSNSKEYFILKISGDSMNEIFDDGEYVLIEKTSAIYDNDLVIAIIEGEATCKKIRFYDDEVNLIPMSTNPNHKTQIYTSKEVKICGKVVGKLSDYLEKR